MEQDGCEEQKSREEQEGEKEQEGEEEQEGRNIIMVGLGPGGWGGTVYT